MVSARLWLTTLSLAALCGYGIYELFTSWEFDPALVLRDWTEEPETPDKPAVTYGEYFKSRGRTVVDADTSHEQLGNILLGRMFPHYRKEHKFNPNQMFEGSPAVTLAGKTHTGSDGKTMFLMDKNSPEDTEKLRNACVKALDSEMPAGTGVRDPHLYRLREWCTVPKVRDVLVRHKMKFPKTDAEWREILKSDWITDPKYHDKQGFFTKEELAKLTGSDEKIKLDTLKTRCKASLSKPYERTNFPAPKAFLNGITGERAKDKKVDDFQEAAIFCTVPMKVSDYIHKAMQGFTNTAIPQELKSDFCYIEDKANDINYFRDIKTTDPMYGKSFWCAVRLMYFKNNKTPSTSA